jgi:KaiC domain protein
VSEDDDWFERKLHEDEEGEDAAPDADAEADGEAADPEAVADESGVEAESRANDDASTSRADDGAESGIDGDGTQPETDNGTAADDATESEADDATDAAEDTGASGPDSPDTDSPDTDSLDADASEASDEELFDEGFGSAFQDAPGGGGPTQTGGSGGSDGGEFDGGGGEFDAGGSDGFGGIEDSDADGGFGGEDGGFESGGDFGMGGDDFAGGGGDDFGMGGGFGGGDEPFESEEFDDEEFESSIPRIDVGIEGLDSMIQGGVPERSLITTIGSAGTGKTTFGLQFLHEGLERGENAVFMTLEESHDRIVDTATEKGWNFEAYEEEGSLAVIDLDPIEMANSLTSIRNDLPRLVEEFGATRLVLDSVSLLEMMYDEQATRRNEIYDFTKSLKQAGVTTMLTSEASEDSAYASRHGIIEYLVDAVFILRYIRSTDDFRETRLAVEIQKIRDANHSREIKPYSITNEGISVYRQANIF